jgi:hypothetical protein
MLAQDEEHKDGSLATCAFVADRRRSFAVYAAQDDSNVNG